MWRAAVLCLVFSCLGCVEERVDECADGCEITSGPQARFVVAPDPLSFAAVARGEVATLTFQVFYTGDETIRVESVEVVEGDEDSDREIMPGAQWSPRFEIGRGEAPQTMTLEWRPVNEVRDTAKVRFKVVDAVNAIDGVFEVDVTTPPVAR